MVQAAGIGVFALRAVRQRVAGVAAVLPSQPAAGDRREPETEGGQEEAFGEEAGA